MEIGVYLNVTTDYLLLELQLHASQCQYNANSLPNSQRKFRKSKAIVGYAM